MKKLKKENEEQRGKKHKRIEDDDFEPEVNSCIAHTLPGNCNLQSTSCTLQYYIIAFFFMLRTA